MNTINDNKKIEMNNEIIINKNIIINESLLTDDAKTLNLVRQSLLLEGSQFADDIPENFDVISDSMFSQIKEIDNAHQYNYISSDVAIRLIAELFKRDGERKHVFKMYTDELLLKKLKELEKILEIKHLDLLHALNRGSISEKEFLAKFSKLRELSTNSLEEIITSADNLKKHLK